MLRRSPEARRAAMNDGPRRWSMSGGSSAGRSLGCLLKVYWSVLVATLVYGRQRWRREVVRGWTFRDGRKYLLLGRRFMWSGADPRHVGVVGT